MELQGVTVLGGGECAMVEDEDSLGTWKAETCLPEGSQMGGEVRLFSTWSPR